MAFLLWACPLPSPPQCPSRRGRVIRSYGLLRLMASSSPYRFYPSRGPASPALYILLHGTVKVADAFVSQL